MNRIVVFAHYDRDAIIEPYVLYYLQGLRQVASRILFVSDSPLPPGEIAKLEGITEFVSASRHGEYDFGSWKRGIAHLGPALGDCDELILVNDSCYAPVFPFAEAFDRMAAVECDAWSGTATGDEGRVKHLNSYFQVYRRSVLRDSAFHDFWPQVVAQPDHDEVVRQYENRLSEMLVSRGYRLRSLIPPDSLPLILHGDYVHHMAVHRAPWLKVQLFRDNPLRLPQLGAALAEINRSYPRALIDGHLRRIIGTDNPSHYHFRLGTFRRRWRSFQIIGRTRSDRWWKVQVRLFGIRIIGFGLPLRPRR